MMMMNESDDPKCLWDGRKKKRFAKKIAKRLRVGSYAFGCTGHPGIVVSNELYSNEKDGVIEIESIVNGNVETCSTYHCCPDSTSKEIAEKFARIMVEDAEVDQKSDRPKYRFARAQMECFPDAVRCWREQFEDPENAEYVRGKTIKEFLDLTDAEYALFLDIEQR